MPPFGRSRERASSPRKPKRERPARTVKQRAVALLARREYSRAELAARLRAGGAPAAEVEAVLDELGGLGLLSDARFAVALVHQRADGYSRRAIQHALREKGVAAEDAKAALAELDGQDDLANASALWQRRFGTPPRDEREKARQLRFLLSRGYSHAIALKVLKNAGLRDAGDEPLD